ncbi:DUF2922 domain-containing protein [Desemzia sp. RIT804]|uniref:DUF2922 domain-containing protein n=1 Tax=Desemzia sp. RIT 804 TaxID=2810209 RepID=UPI00194F09D7|nr:DUF2922 domain-containing protein [Desemzia sp. RIT 804]MBM6615910.1 DUF2922 domain-containing protein [Desemzia sp. RIT 804]
MTKTLELKFSTSAGKTKTMSVKDPILDLSPTVAKQAMDKIINLNIFEVDGVNPYAGRLSARYVERILTDIFETE